jgi:extracellular elastinolytic metalloproteinase
MRGILLAGFLSSAAYVRGHPAPEARTGAALQRRTIDLNAFRLPALSEYINATVTDSTIDSSSFNKRADYVDTASELVKSKAPDATFRVVQDHYVGANGIAHVVWITTFQLSIEHSLTMSLFSTSNKLPTVWTLTTPISTST